MHQPLQNVLQGNHCACGISGLGDGKGPHGSRWRHRGTLHLSQRKHSEWHKLGNHWTGDAE